MRAEAAALAKELGRHQVSLKKRLQALEKRLQKDTDTVLLSELGAIRDELGGVRRALARLSISEQSTAKLKNEWHDWMRHAEWSEGIEHALREERLEMLASELRLRGVHVGLNQETRVTNNEYRRKESGSTIFDTRYSAPEPVSVETSVLEEIVVEEVPEDSVDWAAACEYWEQLIAGCDPMHTDARQLARLLKGYRHVQGEKTRHDRAHGTRRYRLQAFEAWH